MTTTTSVSRRDLLRGVGALALTSCARAFGCGRQSSGALEPAPSAAPTALGDGALEALDWTFPASDGEERRCVVMVPRALPPGTRLPLLIALHGLGETRDPRAGAFGWLESYRLDETARALHHPPLTRAALGELVDAQYLDEMSRDARPYQGLVIATPYLPKSAWNEGARDAFTRWLVEVLHPRLVRETPILAEAASTGIDGVSFGGVTALRIGLSHAERFGVVGSLQAAIGSDDDVAALATLAQRSLGARRLRLVTSTEDPFRPRIESLHARLDAVGVPHELKLTPGPHDYAWNRGAGAIEMLRWHDRKLRGRE